MEESLVMSLFPGIDRAIDPKATNFHKIHKKEISGLNGGHYCHREGLNHRL